MADVGVDESNVQPNNGHLIRAGRVTWLAVDELKCPRCSVARPMPDEYAGRGVGPGQASHRERSIDLEITSA